MKEKRIRDGTRVLTLAMGNLELLFNELARDFSVEGKSLLWFRVPFWTPLRCLLEFQVEMEEEKPMSLEFR